MKKKGWEDGRFLIDGLPRNIENMSTWINLMGEKVYPPFIIFLDRSEETMLSRIKKRATTSGRSDDDPEVFRKRMLTYKT